MIMKGQDKFIVEDTIVNERLQTEKVAFCYHFSFGYPLVQKFAKIVNVPAKFAEITKPTHCKEEECILVYYSEDVVR